MNLINKLPNAERREIIETERAVRDALVTVELRVGSCRAHGRLKRMYGTLTPEQHAAFLSELERRVRRAVEEILLTERE